MANNNNDQGNNTDKRGFASMDEDKQREIASQGGKTAHSNGTAHEWTSEEARKAGQKGGKASHGNSNNGQTESISSDSAVDPLLEDDMGPSNKEDLM